MGNLFSFFSKDSANSEDKKSEEFVGSSDSQNPEAPITSNIEVPVTSNTEIVNYIDEQMQNSLKETLKFMLACLRKAINENTPGYISRGNISLFKFSRLTEICVDISAVNIDYKESFDLQDFIHILDQIDEPISNMITLYAINVSVDPEIFSLLLSRTKNKHHLLQNFAYLCQELVFLNGYGAIFERAIWDGSCLNNGPWLDELIAAALSGEKGEEEVRFVLSQFLKTPRLNQIATTDAMNKLINVLTKFGDCLESALAQKNIEFLGDRPATFTKGIENFNGLFKRAVELNVTDTELLDILLENTNVFDKELIRMLMNNDFKSDVILNYLQDVIIKMGSSGYGVAEILNTFNESFASYDDLDVDHYNNLISFAFDKIIIDKIETFSISEEDKSGEDADNRE
jgi:hypothetical protein